MKVWLLTVLLLGVLLSAALADKKKSRSNRTPKAKTFVEAEKEDADDDDDDDVGDEDEDEDEDDGKEKEQERMQQTEPDTSDRKNPCADKICRRGETCIVDKKLRPRCVCYTKCLPGPPGDSRFKVCSKRNVTYESECALDRDHCLCRRQQDGCSNPKLTKIRLDYYGPCQEMTRCTEREFKEFPRRTRDWLFVVMEEMAKRAEIPQYLDVLETAREEANHTHAILWKYCDLDTSPHDNFVSRRELLFTIQSLKAMEHCLLPFLDTCDTDSDGNITLWEWGRCLGVDDDKIKDVCKAIRKAAGKDKK